MCSFCRCQACGISFVVGEGVELGSLRRILCGFPAQKCRLGPAPHPGSRIIGGLLARDIICVIVVSTNRTGEDRHLSAMVHVSTTTEVSGRKKAGREVVMDESWRFPRQIVDDGEFNRPNGPKILQKSASCCGYDDPPCTFQGVRSRG
jgi:hypothetical protein